MTCGESQHVTMHYFGQLCMEALWCPGRGGGGGGALFFDIGVSCLSPFTSKQQLEVKVNICTTKCTISPDLRERPRHRVQPTKGRTVIRLVVSQPASGPQFCMQAAMPALLGACGAA